jgi:putative mycofactocin binding protein MftB
MNRQSRIRLSNKATLRNEAFGALIYSYAERRLLFIDQRLLPFLTAEGTRNLGDIADSLIAEGAIKEASVSKTLILLEGLHQKGVVDVL